MIEAIRFGCLPLLPNRLVYPEILPSRFHASYLYRGREELTGKLISLLKSGADRREDRHRLSEAMRQYSWKLRIQFFDEELERLVSSSNSEKS